MEEMDGHQRRVGINMTQLKNMTALLTMLKVM
jgi:hypothetical protein